MENKKSVGKYMLIFEPSYVYYQYAVRFTSSGDVDVVKIDKYTDKPIDDKKKSVKKNLLVDIDKVLTPLTDLNSFFKTYINPSIFSYDGFNIHKMFIGYKFNEKMHTLEYVIDNKELNDRLSFADGSKINDYYGRKKAIDLILTSEHNSFLTFMNDSYRTHNTGLSSSTLNIANRLRLVSDIGGGYYEHEELERMLDEKLTSYKEYREMFLLRQRYVDYLGKEKSRLNKAKKSIVQELPNDTKRNNSLVYEQMSLFDSIDSEEPITKIKK